MMEQPERSGIGDSSNIMHGLNCFMDKGPIVKGTVFTRANRGTKKFKTHVEKDLRLNGVTQYFSKPIAKELATVNRNVRPK